MSSSARAVRIRERLVAEFSPVHLEVEDESRRHAGHAGAAGGGGHFRVRIVADAFRGKAFVAIHRMVYAALADMLEREIHALAIDASAPPAPDPQKA